MSASPGRAAWQIQPIALRTARPIASPLWALALATGLLFAGTARALTVTIGSPSPRLFTVGHDGASGTYASEERNPTALPYAETVSAISGDAHATSAFDLSNAGFDLSFEQATTSDPFSWASSQGRDFLFTVDTDADYSASGAYAVSDPIGAVVNMLVWLQDETAGSEIFYAYQESRGSPDQRFTLGFEEGTLANRFRGSLTGSLIAGHEYRLTYDYTIGWGGLLPATEATASGSFALSLVPEPGTGVLLACGLGLGLISAPRSRGTSLLTRPLAGGRRSARSTGSGAAA